MTISRVFGRSPISLLKKHLEEVRSCTAAVPKLLDCFWGGDRDAIVTIGKLITQHERRADELKQRMRAQLAGQILLPINRALMMQILSLQDDLADLAEDLVVLTSLRQMPEQPQLQQEITELFRVSLLCCEKACESAAELALLVESSFGGPEGRRIAQLGEECAQLEQQADEAKHICLRTLYHRENELNFITFDLWSRIIALAGHMADTADNLAERLSLLVQ